MNACGALLSVMKWGGCSAAQAWYFMKTEDGFRRAMQIHSLYNKMVALQPRNICSTFPKAATLPEGGVVQVNHSTPPMLYRACACRCRAVQ